MWKLTPIAFGALHVVHALAQSPALPPAVLPDVVVSATRSERDSADVPVAIDTLRERIIREDQPQVNLSETLNRVPGISVLNRQNYAQDVQISLRGFGARSTFGVRGIRLIADGIPATSPDGQAQASSFALSSVERIEVMRGPFSSLYGNAAGGVIQLFTADGPREPTLSGSVVAGSYGTYKLDTQFGGQYRDLNYRLDVSRFHTGGYREHSAATRDITNGKFKLPVASGLLTLVVNTLDQPEAQDPLGLTRAQVARNRRQVDTAAITFNTRKSVRQNQAGLVYEFETDARNQFQARLYSGDRQITQYLAIPLSLPNGTLVQRAPTHSGGVVDLDRGYGGAGLRWTHAVIEGDRPLTLTGGLDYDRQAENRKGFLNVNGVVGDLKRDERDVVSSTDAYAQLEWRMSERWSSAAGLRHSRVRFDSQDYFIVPGTLNGDDSGVVSFVKTNPVAGVVYRLSQAWSMYANIGRGFETPTFAELAYRPNSQSGLNFALQPSTSLHKEIGLKGRLTSATRVNLALFHINTTNEIVVNSATGGRTDYKNAPGTRRDGIEFSVGSKLPAGFEAYASYTRLNAEFTQPFTSSGAVVPAGSKLAGVPQNSLFGELVWRHAASGFHTGAEVRAAGRVFVDDLNSESASPYTVANLRAGFEQRSKAWRVTEFVRVDNVTDRQYVGSVIVADTNRRFYEPSPGRNYLVGVSASLRF
jgi:iron complex outermembrane recepter protein